jgi:proteasome accessory factor B
MFRLSRVHGQVVLDRRSGTYEVPEGTDLRAITSMLAPAPAERTATVLVRQGAGHGLRRHAEPDGPETPQGWDRLRVRYAGSGALADEVLGYGADVVVLEPAEVRAMVVDRLEELAGVSR